MTPEELKEYEKLSPNAKDAYNMGMRQHPDWTHTQALTFATIVLMTEPPKEPPIGTTLKDIYIVTVKKAQEFIKNDFPRIYLQVKSYFVNAIDWLENAVVVTIDRIINFFK